MADSRVKLLDVMIRFVSRNEAQMQSGKIYEFNSQLHMQVIWWLTRL